MRNTQEMKVAAIFAAVTAFCFLVSAPLASAVTITSDGWNVLSTFGAVTCTDAGSGSLTIGFPRVTTIPPNCRATVGAASSTSAGYFSGNLLGLGVTTATFGVAGTGVLPKSGQTYIIMRGTTPDPEGPREWYHVLNVSTAAGAVAESKVDLRSNAEWTTFASGDLAAKWAEDMASVQTLGVQIQGTDASPSPAYSFTLSAVAVESTKDAGSVDALRQALLDRFGVSDIASVPAESRGIDSDTDGITDLDEIRLAFEPGYFSKAFKASVESSDQGVAIKWVCVKDKVYTVLRADSMNSEFAPVFSGVATDTGYASYVDTEAEQGVSYFYRVVQQ